VGGGESVFQHGSTVLMFVAENGRADCARLLIDAGAKKGAKDNVRRESLPSNCTFSFLTAFYTFTFMFCNSRTLFLYGIIV
jgi:hypothetical protein